MRKDLPSGCTLDPMIILVITMEGREHPCDRCNEDREKCGGYPRADSNQPLRRTGRVGD